MANVANLGQLFRRRHDTSWKGYVPVTIVAALFTLMGLHDGLPLLMIAILLVSVLQLYFRTFAGWLLLLAVCLWYGVEVTMSPPIRYDGEWVFFMLCGFLPAIALVVWRPRLAAK